MTDVSVVRHCTKICAGLLLAFCMLSCQPIKPGPDRIAQGDMECETILRAAWGEGPGELGYVPDSQPSSSPRKPFRFRVNGRGRIYVADLHNERILVFAADGLLLQSIRVPMLESGEVIEDIAVGGDRLAVATTRHVYVADEGSDSFQVLEWPAEVGQYGRCSEDMAGSQVQVDQEGNVYACAVGGFERGGTIVQFDRDGRSKVFWVGGFDHFVVGWDGFVYVEQINYTDAIDGASDSRVRKFDLEGKQLSELLIGGQDLANAGLIYPGLLVAVDAKGDLYGNVVNVHRDGELVAQEGLVGTSARGQVLQIIEYDTFKRPATDVIDGEGNLYLWRFGQVPAEPAEIWRCRP